MLFCCITVFVLDSAGQAQNKKPSVTFSPRHYICYKTLAPITVDGNLNEQSWKNARWTGSFLDIEDDTKPAPRYQTQTKMVWDDTYLYIAAQLQEPEVWATLKKRDSIIFHDNDFEVFIDPDGDTHDYYELELNALGTVWDLMLTRPYRNNGQAIDAWDVRGLQLGVKVHGTLNNSADTDSGWTVELALPWNVLEEAASGGHPPHSGDQWRMNFSRVEWRAAVKNGSYKKKTDRKTGKPLAEDNWVWSPQGVINMHYPEMWGYVQFSDHEAGCETDAFVERKSEIVKWYLRLLYYRQYQYKKRNDTFASHLKQINAQELFARMKLDRKLPGLKHPVIQGNMHTFEIRLKDTPEGKTWFIRENGKVWSSAD